MNLRKPQLTLVKSSSSKPSHSLTKGIAAGLAGGVVASAAFSLVRRAYPPRTQKALPPPEGSGSRGLALRKRLQASKLLHLGVGAAAGAAYGAVAEYYPPATAKDGAAFGMSLAAFSQDGALSALGLTSPLETTRERSSATASFVAFGIVTETVRRIVRRSL
jgi:putative membrane protein